MHTSETAESTRRQFYTEYGWEGRRYNSNMTTTEIAKATRIYCKEKYPTWKFSVTSKYFSGGSEITIAVMEAPHEIFNREHCRKEYESNKDNWQRGIAWNIEKMYEDNDVHLQLHSVSDHYKDIFTEVAFAVLNDVYGFMQSYNFDDSDAMIDYFHCNFYSHFEVGKWNKSFKIVEKKARIKEKSNAPVPTSNTHEYEIKEDEHTKTGAKIWVVKILDSLSKNEYIQESKKMKELGGYYSRFKHGFIFNAKPLL